MKNIIIGTAGHIDHGKTTLIKALTGRETDTLEEEKQRGISINLGFTFFDLPNNKRVGIVDVPGHEKFIKNMLAGASGIDMVLLVVAADEGVMPQTVEHMDILSYLNVQKGIVVLTKADTVDEELLEIVKDDVREQLQNTFLKDSTIIEVDSVSRRGIDTLINEIDKISEEIEDKNTNSPARLNIDRVFSVKGFGTVITGTLNEGKISIDDELIIYPKQLKAKIRTIQVHGKDTKIAYAGQRTAINISNVKVDEIKRGDVLAEPNSLTESMMIDVKASVVNHTDKSIKHWERLRLYIGAREILCRAVPLHVDEIKSGESGFVQLRLEDSIVCKKGDKFVLRFYSPMETIGGGVIVDPSPKKHKRYDDEVIEVLKKKEKGELKDIIEEYIKSDINVYSTIKDLMEYTGENKVEIEESLEKLIQENKVIKINSLFIHQNKYENLKENIKKVIEEYHSKYKLRNGIPKEELRSRVLSNLKNKDMDVFLNKLVQDNLVKLVSNEVALSSFEVVLTKEQKNISDRITKRLKECGLSAVLTIDEVSENNPKYREVLESMIGKEVERLDEQYVMDTDVYEQAKNILIDYLKQNKEITLGEYRDLINSSRKNCMIILENFDRIKITKRIENKRILF
ncbi:MAG: selenocysteine-specific translation elongation factor [Clostridioides sp.]|jgi:selenocysteine-specific elongation factor|nr:selenocysteine-specific translation elongation factor [Clostridioides sp.]